MSKSACFENKNTKYLEIFKGFFEIFRKCLGIFRHFFFRRDSWTILRDICVKAYDNNKVYSPIKMTPTEGSVKKNKAIVYENLFGDLGLAPTCFKFNVGDRVRIVKKKKAFEKGYTPRWTEEVFTTSKQQHTKHRLLI